MPELKLEVSGPPVRSGDRIAHYEILAEVGRGGTGIVYRARDLLIGREVALKRLRPEFAADDEIRQRFLREPKAAARVNHPGAVPIFEVFEARGAPWIAMQFVEGKSLRELLTERGALPVEDVIDYGVQLAEALQAAHERHVVHRDVTPNNILVTPERRVVITDFGVARFFTPPGSLGDTHSASITVAGTLLGTPPYLSPEQVLGRELDGRTDIFALGAVLYELCTGRLAFPATQLSRLVDDILNHEPEPIGRLNYAVTEELERIIRKALRKSPDERYQSARELGVDLRALRAPTPPAGTPRHRARVGRLRVGTLPRVGPFVTLLVVACVAFALILREGFRHRLPECLSRQLTTAEGWEAEPALSPTGEFVAYVSNEADNSDIWFLHIRTSRLKRLTSDPAEDHAPAWFPAGDEIVFASRRGGREGLWRMPLFGGEALPLPLDGTDPAVSPDGTRLAYAAPDSLGRLRICVAPFEDLGRARQLTGDDDGLWSHRRPAWSPDGRTLCYTGQQDLWLVPAGGGRAHALTTRGFADVRPVWAPARDHIYFSGYWHGVQALWRVGTDGHNVERLTSGNGPESYATLSADRKRLAYSTFAENPDIILHDRASGVEWRLPGLRQDLTPTLRPDGGAVVFASDRLGAQFDLWFQTLEMGRPLGEPRRLTHHPGNASFPAFSPDGRYVAYYRIYRARAADREDRRDIWMVPADGGTPLEVVADALPEVQPAFAPDGRRLVYVVNDRGMERLRVIPLGARGARGPAVTLDTDGVLASRAVFSPDGGTVAFIGESAGQSDVWFIRSDGTGRPWRITHGAGAHEVRFDRGGSQLLVSGTWSTERSSLRSLDPVTGHVAPADSSVAFGPAGYYADFDVAANGRLLTYVRDGYQGDIWLLEAQRGAW